MQFELEYVGWTILNEYASNCANYIIFFIYIYIFILNCWITNIYKEENKNTIFSILQINYINHVKHVKLSTNTIIIIVAINL